MRRLAGLPPEAQRSCEARVREAMERLRADELIYRPEALFCVARDR